MVRVVEKSAYAVSAVSGCWRIHTLFEYPVGKPLVAFYRNTPWIIPGKKGRIKIKRGVHQKKEVCTRLESNSRLHRKQLGRVACIPTGHICIFVTWKNPVPFLTDGTVCGRDLGYQYICRFGRRGTEKSRGLTIFHGTRLGGIGVLRARFRH